MEWFASGIDASGNPRIVGPAPFEDAIDLMIEDAELRQPHIFQANSRQEAEQMAARKMGRTGGNLLATDGPPEAFDPSRFEGLR